MNDLHRLYAIEHEIDSLTRIKYGKLYFKMLHSFVVALDLRWKIIGCHKNTMFTINIHFSAEFH